MLAAPEHTSTGTFGGSLEFVATGAITCAVVAEPGRKGIEIFETDEHNRPDTPLDALAKLKPAFYKDGSIRARYRVARFA